MPAGVLEGPHTWPPDAFSVRLEFTHSLRGKRDVWALCTCAGTFAYIGSGEALAQVPVGVESLGADVRVNGSAVYVAWRAVYFSKLLSVWPTTTTTPAYPPLTDAI